MRDFSWNVFMKTGDVDAYLLYKEFDEQDHFDDEAEDEQGDAADPLM